MYQYKIFGLIYEFDRPLKAWDIVRLSQMGLVQRLPGIPAKYRLVSEASAKGKEILKGTLLIEGSQEDLDREVIE